MDIGVQSTLEKALLLLLKPLAEICLRQGMAYGVFAELARKAFVEAAFEDKSLSSRRPTVSSVSALTGLTRKETKRLREWDLSDSDGSRQRFSRAVRVISGWAESPEYQDADGKPLTLPLDGDDISFAGLVRRFSGDIPTAAMLSVLESSGSVSRDGDEVRLLQRAYIPESTTSGAIDILGRDVAELVGTIGHNLRAEPGQRRFQRKVSNVLVSRDAVPAFRDYSNRKSQELLEDYHRWLTQHEISTEAATSAAQDACYVAVGIYYAEDTASAEV